MDTVLDSIIIDSKDRVSGTPSNFTIIIPNTYKNAKRYIIKQFTIPLVYDNITNLGGGNDTIELAGATKTITDGQYDIVKLMAQMAVNCAGYNFTFTNNRRVKIDNGGGAAFTFKPLTMDTTLGFTSASYLGANEYTSEQLPNLIPTRYFTLHSEFFARSNKLKYVHTDNRQNLIMYIPISAPIGDIYMYEPQDPVYIELDSTNCHLVDFQLRDEYGDIIDLQGEDFIMSISRY
jgi:hypothetical protein